MTETRWVIPADADPDAVAWPGVRPETWRELSDGCQIEQLGSAWCLVNSIFGLGFVQPVPTAQPAPEPTPDPAPGGNP